MKDKKWRTDCADEHHNQQKNSNEKNGIILYDVYDLTRRKEYEKLMDMIIDECTYLKTQTSTNISSEKKKDEKAEITNTSEKDQ